MKGGTNDDDASSSNTSKVSKEKQSVRFDSAVTTTTSRETLTRRQRNNMNPHLTIMVLSSLPVLLLGIIFGTRIVYNAYYNKANEKGDGRFDDAAKDRIKFLEAQIEEMRKQTEMEDIGQHDSKKKKLCGLYLAPSSIPKTDGSSTYGIFAGRTFHIGDALESIGGGAQSSSAEKLGNNNIGTTSQQCHDPWSFEQSESNINIGSILQHHPYLDSVQICRDTEDFPSPLYRVTRNILPGEEIFMNYENMPSFQNNNNLKQNLWLMKNVPLKHTYDTTDDIVADLFNQPKTKNRNKFMTSNKHPGLNALTLDLVKKAVGRLDNLVSHLLPVNAEDAESIHENGSAYYWVKNRTLSWLESNGQCIDNIKSGVSTIENAGYGAFAKYVIEKGEIITPVPLLILRQSSSIANDTDDIIDKCFGHDQSPLLLCPQSPANLVNHKSHPQNPVTNDDECTLGPNAEYKWSKWNKKNEGIENLKLDYFDHMQYTRDFSLDLVATRKIEPNEEIFIDYGKQWENAWNEYESQCIGKGNMIDSCQKFNKYIGLSDGIFPSAWLHETT